MKYALTVTVNLPDDERGGHFVEAGPDLIGIRIEEILERFPQTTSLVVTVVPIKQTEECHVGIIPQ